MLRTKAPFAVFWLGLMMSACTSWRPLSTTPTEVIQETRPRSVRLTMIDGARSIVDEPEIRSDSIVGNWSEPPNPACDPHPIGRVSTCFAPREPETWIAVADVASVEVKRVDWVPTLLAVVGAGVLYTILKPGPDTVYECRDAGALGRVCGDFVR